MSSKLGDLGQWVGSFLLVYLFVLCFAAAALLVANFPTPCGEDKLCFGPAAAHTVESTSSETASTEPPGLDAAAAPGHATAVDGAPVADASSDTAPESGGSDPEAAEATPSPESNGPPEREANPQAWWSFGRLGSAERGLILLALLAGIVGSFLHATQSLTTYLGNEDFKASWIPWYLLRPWIGGTLGAILYFAVRAGIMTGAGGVGTLGVDPHGVVALGALGGWFSKITTDKLEEVFETLLKTDKDKDRKNKLRSSGQPVLTKVRPNPVPQGTGLLELEGKNFLAGATVLFNDKELRADLEDGRLSVSLTQLTVLPVADSEVVVKVKNPEGREPLSAPFEVTFS